MKEDKIIDKLNEIQKQISIKDNKPLTLIEAANYLNISKSTIYKLTHQNKIPFYKPNGKKIYFSQSELDKWIFKNRVSTSNELEWKAKSRMVN
ncbi:MAG: helix-turn-helix domain-containing protein [Bacteroidetes bacterium]|nr:helix-turn-helix domain-containing protein [Bacteroidota bacterium]